MGSCRPTKNPGKPAISAAFQGCSEGGLKVAASGFEPLTAFPEGQSDQSLAASGPRPCPQTCPRETEKPAAGALDSAAFVGILARLPEAERQAGLDALADALRGLPLAERAALAAKLLR